MAQASANEEGKSSAGDKYETGRAMAQLEIEKASTQLAEANKLKQALEQIILDENNSSSQRTRNSSPTESTGNWQPATGNKFIKPGSLVITNQGNYFISIAAGKLTVDDQTWFAISAGSPLGATLLGKKEGDVVKVMGKDIVVVRVG